MNLVHTAFVPAGDGPFPTLVAIHGWGASAQDLLGLAPILAGGRFLVLCPQGPVQVPIGPGHHGYGWFPLVPGTAPNPVEFAQGAVALRTFLDEALETYPVDRRRTFLLGFSQGGGMGYDLALRYPERFRGLAALSTWMPPALAESLPKGEATRGFPVLVVHGTEDPLVEIQRGRDSRDRLEEFGVDLTYHEFPMGHEIRPEALRELDRWLVEKLEASG